jgi:hypothetical protein
MVDACRTEDRLSYDSLYVLPSLTEVPLTTACTVNRASVSCSGLQEVL